MDDPAEKHAAERPIRRVALIGTGPVSASLALAWKAARPALAVTGLDEPEVLDAAEASGALDRKAASLEAAATEADLVVLAGRLPAALRQLEALAPHLEAGALVTDTGAVKQPIARHAADVLPSTVSFIGGHPVSAAERPASEAPDAARFDGGTYILCPPAPEETPGSDFAALAEATGARVRVMPAERHDRLCATARDLPELMAAALAEVASEAGDHETLHALAAPAVRSFLWGHEALTDERREELVAGEGAILDALGRYVRALQHVRRQLAAGDVETALGVSEPEDK